MGKQGYGIDPERLADYTRQIKEVQEMGVQIGIVIGGGNIFRGLSGSQKGFDRVKGDQMGMCATVINSLALSSALGALGCLDQMSLNCAVWQTLHLSLCTALSEKMVNFRLLLIFLESNIQAATLLAVPCL